MFCPANDMPVNIRNFSMEATQRVSIFKLKEKKKAFNCS